MSDLFRANSYMRNIHVPNFQTLSTCTQKIFLMDQFIMRSSRIDHENVRKLDTNESDILTLYFYPSKRHFTIFYFTLSKIYLSNFPIPLRP